MGKHPYPPQKARYREENSGFSTRITAFSGIKKRHGIFYLVASVGLYCFSVHFPKQNTVNDTVLRKESDSGFFRFNDSHLQKCKSEHGKQPEAFAGQIFGFLFRKYRVPGFRKVVYIESYLLT